MSNSTLTSQVIAKEALMQFKNSLIFTRGANTQYDEKFARNGAKIGNSINIRVPQRFESKSGKNAIIQDVVNTVRTLELDQREHVAFQFSSEELTLDIDQFSELYIKPAVLALANKVDYTGLEEGQLVYNAVGTPGTAPATLAVPLAAGRKLDENSCPMDDRRNMLLNPEGQASMVGGLTAIFQDASEISKQYKRGRMGTAAGFEWGMAQNIMMHTIGAQGGTPLVDGASQTGATLSTKGWTAAASNRLKKGDIFTIAGVYAINPLTYQSTGALKQFVATADFASDGSGDGDISISPEINATATDPTRNVSALPANEAALTVLGAASVVTPLNMAYHKNAFILGCADLEMPRGVDMASRASDPESGLAIRFVRQWDVMTDDFVSRFDILFGWLTAHPEWACRVQG